MRRAAKVDATQQEIVEALRAHGCKVLSLAGVANGCPDLLVYRPIQDRVEAAFHWALFGSQIVLLEVKNPKGRGTKLTPDQVKFHAEWPVSVVTNAAEALRAVGLDPQPEK